MLLVALSLSAPSSASAVRITQHPIPKLSQQEVVSPASNIFDGPQGLLIAGARGSGYQTVTTAPTFAVSQDSAGGPALAFFLGPDGQTWLISSVVIEKIFQYVTINKVTPGSSVVQFTYPTTTSFPLSAATEPDGAILLAEPTDSELDRFAGGVLTELPMPFGGSGPVRIAIGAGEDAWATDLSNGTVAQVAPDGAITEHRLNAGGWGGFGPGSPYGIIVAPDGTPWFVEQDPGAIGHIAADGEVQTFPIPPPAGWLPGNSAFPEPRDVTVGPEGAIWFTDPGTNSVGRVMDGQVTEFPIPGVESAGPDSIVTVGGEMWFNEDNAPALGSIDPSAAPVEETRSPIVTVTKADVTRILALGGTAARIVGLLKTDGHTVAVTLPAPGSIAITWESRTHATVAAGHATLSKAGSGKLKIRLTMAGKKLLRSSKTLKLTARGTVSLSGTAPVRATQAITVHR
jgi:virginiamycin B lyase